MTHFNPSSAWPAVGLTSPTGAGMPVQAGSGTGVKTGGFQQALANLEPPVKAVTVERGDTLIGMIKTRFRDQQSSVSDGQALRFALEVAKNNQLNNPNLIHPGQKIDLSRVQMPAQVRNTTSVQTQVLPAAVALHAFQDTSTPPGTASLALAARNASLSAPQEVQTPFTTANNSHPVLERTLARAVDKGFVAPKDVPAVRDKVMGLAERYNFAPDDFARLTLMESGGMNPQASNGSCHGIIQFCDGANRGAAAVGLKNNPRSILGMGLLQQLDLVDRYFSQAGLPAQNPKPGQKLGLDDLYLTVLTPAARQETRPNAPLPIAGPQAKHLHVGGDSRQPITRNSILAGLHAMTDSLLGLAQAKTPGSRWYADAAKTNTSNLR